MTYFPERSVPYRTFLKRITVNALRNAVSLHPDELMQRTKITLEYPRTKQDYPCIVVRFYEREIKNAGIAHSEVITFNSGTANEATYDLRHYYYNGDFEFAIFGLSNLDRDLLADIVVHTITMGDTETWGRHFLDTVYAPGDDSTYPGGYPDNPDAQFNFVTFNTDKMSGFGDSEAPVPWAEEDKLVFQTSYRVGMSGEYYSLPNTPPGFIDEVIFYPYIKYGDPLPEGLPETSETGPWLGTGPKTQAAYDAEHAAYDAQWHYGLPEEGSDDGVDD